MQLLKLWSSIQEWLFPTLQEILGENLTENQKKFIKTCELAELDKFMGSFTWTGQGRPPKSRLSLCKAFIAKMIYDLSATEALIDLLKSSPVLRRLCGWETVAEIPNRSTFSRSFEQFTNTNLAEIIHSAMVKKVFEYKPVGHISRDSTEIIGREKIQNPKKSEETKTKTKRKRGRPKKGEEREKIETVIQKQLRQSLEENLNNLPNYCNAGTKKCSKGYKHSWVGWKLHIDCADGDIPVSAILTSASVYDNQVSIPLAQKTATKVTNFYDLMDAGYDCKEIREFSSQLGHIPIIDHNKRRGEKCEFLPHEKQRYKERSSIERVNSNLKDNYAARKIYVKGHAKVFTHLMFGLIALTASQVFKLLE